MDSQDLLDSLLLVLGCWKDCEGRLIWHLLRETSVLGGKDFDSRRQVATEDVLEEGEGNGDRLCLCPTFNETGETMAWVEPFS